MFELLKKYTEMPGPLGHEHRVQKAFMDDLKPLTDEIQLTNTGNVVAHFPGEGRKIVVFGHADEICYYVLSVSDEGFLRIVSYATLRGEKVSYPYCLVGQKALVIGDEKDARGVFATPSAHVLYQKEREQPLDTWSVHVDIGASSSDEVAELGIHPGSPIIWNPTTERIGKKAFGKAMDDRFAHAVMLELAKRLEGSELSCDLYMASTVQEEIGLKGAEDLRRGGYDISLALDVGIAGDYPTLEKGRMPIKLGDGPALVYKDGFIHYNIEIIKELRRTAEKNGIPYQHGIFTLYGSDSGVMMAGGAKPNLIAPPCRYTHLPIEMVHLDDIENTIKLLYHYITK
ncbi:hypothetical protein AC482_03505 [miscellaneous Crenarchaeota group-15 archaeon DG-45]|uniref:Peptidase M42 n=1 Tax=miscellaneous Crenarchaeota group-15 archaeon DG-45 TaxID=1685127 RepID=A0A0M0BQS4_9ARCH|nr:MAG: hypothetical protein AC482_03505 [miscellaneous Crenarchaeota group-15 archaeon DG-45]